MTPAGAEIERRHSCRAPQIAQRRDVAFGDVHDMDVIANSGAVRGFPIVAIDHDLGRVGCRDLREYGDQIVRRRGRSLSDLRRRMCSRRIEIAQ